MAPQAFNESFVSQLLAVFMSILLVSVICLQTRSRRLCLNSENTDSSVLLSESHCPLLKRASLVTLRATYDHIHPLENREYSYLIGVNIRRMGDSVPVKVFPRER